jgi:hypothetical protein
MTRLKDWCIIVLFAVGLALPALRTMVHPGSSMLEFENRSAAPPPALALEPGTIADLPTRFEAYWDDRFGFRTTLLRWSSKAKARWLGVSPSAKVLIGKEGWLYYAGSDSLENQPSPHPFTADELAAWETALESRNDWLEKRGVRFLVVVAPNASTIYPEYLPDAFMQGSGSSRLDQLVAHLGAHSRVSVVDVREDLRRAKVRERVYCRTDSHWNDRGAFVAYQAIVKALARWFPALAPLPRAVFEDVARQEPGGDLATMIGLRHALREDALRLNPRFRPRATPADPAMTSRKRPSRRAPWAVETGDVSLPRAVMLRDSFGGALIPFLSEHFQRILYLFTDELRPPIVERERPDVVIMEFVERRLTSAPPANPPDVSIEDPGGRVVAPGSVVS